MKQTIYIPRPVSEKPKEEGRYIVSNGLAWFEVQWSERYSFHEELTDSSLIISWLEPLEVDILKMVEEAFDAGHSNQVSKTEYLKNVSKVIG